MELYLLDDLNRRITVVDKFESIIWTERFSAYGDFELKMPSTFENRSRMKNGVRFTIAKSYRVMTIETVENTVDNEGRRILVLRGRSLESILENRLARDSLASLTTTPKWSITDQPADIARKLFHDVCVTGVLTTYDILTVTEARMPLFPADTIAEPSNTVTYAIDPIPLYKAIKDICDYYAMGFRLVKHPDTNVLYWDVYVGSNRTTQQTTLPAVVFSAGLDNLSNTTELTSNILYKNVAYVLSPVGSEIVLALDVDPTISGFERNILVVVADDITDGVPATATAKMIQRGNEELAKNRRVSAFDGELNQNSQYVYGTHYNLGDLVEFQNEDGTTAIMQVTEQIFVADKEGERSYPTLVINSFITEGAWDTSAPDLVWDAVNPATPWDSYVP